MCGTSSLLPSFGATSKVKIGIVVAVFLIAMGTVASGPRMALAQSASRKKAGSSQPAALVAVHAKGSQRYSETDIAAAAGLKIGATVRPQDFNAAADQLVATGAFEEVKYRYEPAGNGYAVTFEVIDAQQFIPVSYDNFVWFTDEQLTDAVHQRFPLFKGEVSTNEGMLEKVSDALQSVLTDRGIPGTVRPLQEGTYGHGEVEGKVTGVVFTIEGVSPTIRKVSFSGAADTELPELQKAAEKLVGTAYRRSLVASFADNNLRPIYGHHGYLKASFSKPELKLLKDDGQDPEIGLSFAVQPGTQYRVEKIRWWGNKSFNAEDLQKMLGVKPGAVADTVVIDSDVENLQKLYLSKGYLRARVAANPMFNEAEGTVSYEFAVKEGDVYRMRDVDVSGAGLTKDTLARLRDAWQLREGEPYNAGYEREYLKATRRLLTPNVTVEVNKSINDESKTVDVSMTFVFHGDKVIQEDK